MTKLKVLLTTEGTYPFHQGGVSTWCDTLVKELDTVNFIIYSVITDPFITQKFKISKGTKLYKIPLWGTEEPSEHLLTPFSLVYLQKMRTTDKVIKQLFLPLFKDLIFELINPQKKPEKLGEVLYQIYQYFQEYEYKKTFKSEVVWNYYKKCVLEWVQIHHLKLPQPDIYDLIQSLGWVYRFLNIVNTKVPKSHVSHSSASAFCGIPCVIAKFEHKTPFLLTEHGVYLREQYLSLSKRNLSPYLNTFLIRFIHSITALNFHFADQVSPVCHYNTRWETKFGVQQDKIEVIYNGVDTNVFYEDEKVERINPTVVTVARIDPIKDIVTLIETAEIVKRQIPNVKFIIYGSVSVQGYYEECLALVKKLNLQETVIFAGHLSNIVSAYQSGDVVALSSISEAFPYSVVEAMMSAKPVVATDVGGIREALGNTGFLVKPRSPEEFAKSITLLLKNSDLRKSLARDARERALNYFTLDKVTDLHLKSYLKLVTCSDQQRPSLQVQQNTRTIELQKLYSEKGYALLLNGFYREAIEQFKFAINVDPNSPASFVYRSEIAKAYYLLGETEIAKKQSKNLSREATDSLIGAQ